MQTLLLTIGLPFVILSAFGATAFAGDWAASVVLPEGEAAERLFNGRDLAGWRGRTDLFSADHGTIRAANEEPVPASNYLFTANEYRGFRLLLEVKQTTGDHYSTMHSAVAALGEQMVDDGQEYGFRGPLLMFCHDWGVWDAHRRDRVEPANQKGPIADAHFEKRGDWNQIEILVVGDRIRMVANGHLVFDFTDKPTMLQKSPIGLQLHANDRPQEFHFRDLLIIEDPQDRLATLRDRAAADGR